jgi:hypothetical protein
VREAFGGARKGCLQGAGALHQALLDETMMHVTRRQQADAGMMVLFVVPVKEIDAEICCQRCLDRTASFSLQVERGRKTRSGGVLRSESFSSTSARNGALFKSTPFLTSRPRS